MVAYADILLIAYDARQHELSRQVGRTDESGHYTFANVVAPGGSTMHVTRDGNGFNSENFTIKSHTGTMTVIDIFVRGKTSH